MTDSVHELSYFANDLINGFVFKNRYEAIVSVEYFYDGHLENTTAKIRIEFGFNNTLSFDMGDINPYSDNDKEWLNRETVHLDFDCKFQKFTYDQESKELTIQSKSQSSKFKNYTVKLKQK